jgi:heat-inducible transcriptional repressor
MGRLTPRQEKILRGIITEYVRTAVPVGSEYLVQRCDLGVSAATVRNEMAILEEKGYLVHPHTSAGRIPTDKGYRYYVEHLMGEEDLPLPERLTIQHQFHQVEGDQEEWIRLAVSILSRTLPSAALMTAPKAPRLCRYKHLELIAVQERLVLLVLVLQEGMVKQMMMTMSEPVIQTELSHMANHLNDLFVGMTREEMETRLGTVSGPEHPFVEAVLRIMRTIDEQVIEEIYHNGLHYILDQPEFEDSSKARGVIEVMEKGSLLTALLAEAMADDAVRVVIGAENTWTEQMRMCSLVLARYGLPGQALGVLGLVGPTRMAYWRAIPSVRYMSTTVSRLLGDLHG